MTRWTTKQIIKKRKEERKAQIMGMVGAIVFALIIGACFFYAR